MVVFFSFSCSFGARSRDAQVLLLALWIGTTPGLGGLEGHMGIGPGPAMCKASYQPAVLSLQPPKFHFVVFCFLGHTWWWHS